MYPDTNALAQEFFANILLLCYTIYIQKYLLIFPLERSQKKLKHITLFALCLGKLLPDRNLFRSGF